MKITDWIFRDGYSVRCIVGKDPDDYRYRVALIEKTPRVRIRDWHLGTDTYLSTEKFDGRAWPEHLDWCYGTKGTGPLDQDSMKWCDDMLTLLGYETEDHQ